MSVDERPVTRCARCGLVQYATASGDCRRCGQCLGVGYPKPAPRRVAAPLAARPARKMPDVGRRLRELREARGLTQAALCERCAALSRSFVSRVEHGRFLPSLGFLERLAEALGVGLGVLLREESLTDDPLVREVVPFVRDLRAEHREKVVALLARLGEGVTTKKERTVL